MLAAGLFSAFGGETGTTCSSTRSGSESRRSDFFFLLLDRRRRAAAIIAPMAAAAPTAMPAITPGASPLSVDEDVFELRPPF
jgi:hypothetical protein